MRRTSLTSQRRSCRMSFTYRGPLVDVVDVVPIENFKRYLQRRSSSVPKKNKRKKRTKKKQTHRHAPFPFLIFRNSSAGGNKYFLKNLFEKKNQWEKKPFDGHISRGAQKKNKQKNATRHEFLNITFQ